jgi:hypothetical protein
VKEFTSFNAVHNVWPFWRQVVFDLCRSARLPDVFVGLYRNKSIGELAGGVKQAMQPPSSRKQIADDATTDTTA